MTFKHFLLIFVFCFLVGLWGVSACQPCRAQGWRPYWNRNYMPYQTVPPYPGAIPLYYDGNIPVYDYTARAGTYGTNVFNPFGMPLGPRDLRNHPPQRPRPQRPSRRAGDFDNNGVADRIMPSYHKATPIGTETRALEASVEAPDQSPDRVDGENRAMRVVRTWKTTKGEVFENAHIMGMMDGKVGLKTSDGKSHYVFPDDLDKESKKAFDDWRLRRSK